MASLRAFARFAAVGEVSGEVAWLTGVERARRDRLVDPADRSAYVAAHLLVRQCAAQLLGSGPDELELRQWCATCGSGAHGAPSVWTTGDERVHVSLSHARGHVAAVAARVPCGIDVEPIRDRTPPRGTLSEREAAWVAAQEQPGEAFTRLWVRKEALVKAGAGDLAQAAALDVLDLLDEGRNDRAAGLTLQEWSDGAAVGVYALIA